MPLKINNSINSFTAKQNVILIGKCNTYMIHIFYERPSSDD